MSDEERQQLAVEFGIRVSDTKSIAERFWDSPAFRSLVAWVQKNPRAAARFRSYDAYLPGWYEAACAWDDACASASGRQHAATIRQ
jgi:hypothetical protein